MKLPIIQPASTPPESDLDRQIAAIARLQEIVDGWNEENRRTVTALLTSIEELHREAIVRLIRAVRDDPEASLRLREVASDEFVYTVLRRLGVLKPSLSERLEHALASIRPVLGQHEGDVELVRVDSKTAVTVRLLGACNGCPASGITLREGVERAIRTACPEIETISVIDHVQTSPSSKHQISPFDREATSWHPVGHLTTLTPRHLTVFEVERHSILLWRDGNRITAYANLCAHAGKPLAHGQIHEGVLTCPHHGFRFVLATGECLTAPQTKLLALEVRIVGEQVELKLA